MDETEAQSHAVRAEQVTLTLVELGPPAFIASLLASAVAPFCQGFARAAAIGAIVTVAVFAAFSLIRARRGAERRRASDAALAAAARAVEAASCATRGILETVSRDMLPPLNDIVATARDAAGSRATSVSRRKHFKQIEASGQEVLAILSSIVGPPRAVPVSLEEPPVVAVAEAETLAPSAPAPDATSPFSHPLRILVAEADALNQQALSALLNEAGAEPEIVADRPGVIDAWRLGDWDLILMDVQSSEVDGHEVARLIRAAEIKAGWTPTPILALGPSRLTDDAEGLDGCVAKPVSAPKLIAAIETAMRVSPAAHLPQFAQFADVA